MLYSNKFFNNWELITMISTVVTPLVWWRIIPSDDDGTLFSWHIDRVLWFLCTLPRRLQNGARSPISFHPVSNLSIVSSNVFWMYALKKDWWRWLRIGLLLYGINICALLVLCDWLFSHASVQLIDTQLPWVALYWL